MGRPGGFSPDARAGAALSRRVCHRPTRLWLQPSPTAGMALSSTPRLAFAALRLSAATTPKSKLLAKAFIAYRMASTSAANVSLSAVTILEYRVDVMEQFGLKDASLIHNQGYIDGKWVDAQEGGVIKVTSAYVISRVPYPMSMSSS